MNGETAETQRFESRGPREEPDLVSGPREAASEVPPHGTGAYDRESHGIARTTFC